MPEPEKQHILEEKKAPSSVSAEGSQKVGERNVGGHTLKDDPGLYDRLIHVGRVSKVVKGGRRFGYNALVVVGDRKGKIGFGHGKAREVPESVRKATDAAKTSMMRVPLSRGVTLHHDSKGHWGACFVILRSAKPGTGVIAGGPMRAAFEVLGLRDVVAKSLGSSNPHNMIRATFDALKKQRNPSVISRIRGKKVSEIISAKSLILSERVQEHAREEGQTKKEKTPHKPQAKRLVKGKE